MRANFTNFENAIQTFANEALNMQKQLFECANSKRVELLAIYKDLLDCQADITKFGDMMNDLAGVLIGMNDTCVRVADKIGGAIDFGYDQVPTFSFESYVDTCEICGLDITHEQEYTEGEQGYVHCHCLQCDSVEESVSDEDDVIEKDELPVT